MAQYKILDISEHQPVVDYEEVAKHVDGVILRCGVTHWGTANECVEDECFEKHYAGFKAAGVPVGAYYYSAADNMEKVNEEIQVCKNIISGKQFELPIYYDIEEPNRMEKLTVEQLTEQVKAWCEAMEKAGYFVGVYANTDYFTRKLNHEELSQKYTIWLADYRSNYNKTLKRDMHQYTSTARIGGISADVDMNNCTRDFVSSIKENGLNGFCGYDAEDDTVDGDTIIIGPMSKGDFNTIYSAVKPLVDKLGNIGLEVM